MPHMVRVKFLGFLERVAGQRETAVEIDESATVLDLVSTLADRYGTKFSSSVFHSPRQVHTYLRVFVNEAQAALDDPVVRDTRGSAEVRLLLLPGLEGGS